MNPETAGFSLLEAAIALTIVGLVAVSFLGTVSAQLDGVVRTEEAVHGATLARDVMSRVIASESATIPDSLVRGVFAPPFERFRWSAASQPDPDVSGLFELSVAVEWPTSSFELRSEVFRRP